MKMKENQTMKVCSFYVNDWHLTTMMLPYINRRIGEGANIFTMLENGIQSNVEGLVSKMNLSKESTNRILGISWTSNKMFKYSEIKKVIEAQLETQDDIEIIINGRNEYIRIVNENIDKVVKENAKKLKAKTITLINCYEITQFTNISEVLEQHCRILNTSGIKEIGEVFDGYESKKETKAVNEQT